MKILILGIDGYLGWPLALRMASRGHQVSGIDNLYTRRTVESSGSTSGLPILEPEARIRAAKRHLDVDISFHLGDVTDKDFLRDVIREERPDAIVHFAEQRSAPYSMVSEDTAVYTLNNNITSTMRLIYAVKEIDPTIHILKMGTMGEYGTPNFDIPDSAFVKAVIGGKEDIIPVPKWASSFYHWSKVFDTYLLLWVNGLWGITVTDIMQGPVYGTRISEIVNESLYTRFDFDEVWGTVVNRYCVEAIIGMPLTPYGKGGQTRGFISLEDSMEALRILLENPPKQGEYRVANQFAEVYSVRRIAEIVKEAAEGLGLSVEIRNVENPRVEKEEHYYNPEVKLLPSLGFKPKKVLSEEVKVMLKDLLPYKDRLRNYSHVILPKTKWRK